MDRSKLDYVKDLPGFERGHPHYFKDPMIDHLLEIVMLLGGELWVGRDRRMIAEHLLTTEGKATPGMIEQYEPEGDLAERLAEARQAFTKHVFGCLYEQRDGRGVGDYFDVIGKDE